ncbi:MAG TPA: acyl-CoA thioester hydrolase/BAAT C-terminal domain-containing protein [Gaiellaceae bacterium]|nr:acyl-CoA thioester hydrolase/BAAT C-terminal domain-containing protein [Gaiellaceae bacterium]
MTAAPAEGLLDAPLDVRISGLQPGEAVVLHATELSARRRPWRSSVALRADSRGVVERDARSLLTSLRPVERLPGDAFPADVGHIQLSISIRRHTVARLEVVRRVLSRAVAHTLLLASRDHLVGRYYAPAGAKRKPAILLLGGLEGGLFFPPVAKLLASHGYPTLDLAYFGLPGLPASLERIPLEYFQRALVWLAARPGVDPRRLVVIGASRGAEAALLVASAFPSLVSAVAAYSPSARVVAAPDGRGPAWTLGGRALAPGRQIRVERIEGPLLLVAGLADGLWPSGPSARAIARRARRPATLLAYPGAGHAVDLVLPNAPSSTVLATRDGLLRLGGTPAADAAARNAAWPQLLLFLDRIGSSS